MTPDDSVAPVVPSLSDNPRRGLGGVVSFVNWFKEISDWITGLSPNGATRYDSGQVTTGLTFTTTNVSDLTYLLLRRGKTVTARVDFTYTGPELTGGPDGNVIDQELFTMPPGWRPFNVTYDLWIGATSLYRVGGRIDASGPVSIVDAAPGVTILTGQQMRMNARFELP